MRDSYRALVPAHLRFLVTVHILLLAIFSAFRYITLVYNRPSFFFQTDRTISLWKAFGIGLSFDVTVASYALLVPYLLLTVAFIHPMPHERLYSFVRSWCTAVVLISLLICATDVPYFNFFNSRLTASAVNWKNNVQVVRYLSTEFKYYPFIFIGIVFMWSTGRLMRALWQRNWSGGREYNAGSKWLATGMASLLLLIGLWGGATPQVPNMKKATFSNDGFVNQLTLNPVHTWFDSYWEFNIHPLRRDSAFQLVQKSLHITTPDKNMGSPIQRTHRFDDPRPAKPNVVLVLLESMSWDRTGLTPGGPASLTPYFDSLARQSVLFNNFYSNGIHTNAGIYSTLYSMPIRMMEHPMNNGRSEFTQFSGLPTTLKKSGYSTTFFCTHPKTFDNLDIFLMKNGFDYVSDVADYPKEKVANSWGVGDESLYELALQRMDSLYKNDSKPFFSTVLSITTHPPFTLPAFTQFKSTRQDPVEQTYEYADWSIRQFMTTAAQKPWYNNTIFVFLGDHGVNLQANYRFDTPLSYNHVPMVIHAPAFFPKAQVVQKLGNQTDIYPTVMGILQQNYTQNTLGYDLFREKRPYALFSQDHKLCVIDEEYLYVARKSGQEGLYDYRQNNGDNLNKNGAYADRVRKMREFACANLQTAQWMIENKKTK
jgi:phosphoglycerol transferase MdoB-like AlkP superfamily enzyme